MKAILLPIKPKWVAKILNREKTIEIRKTCPEIFKHLKPYEGCSIDVYIYCTKDKKYANLINRGGFLTGMVVAKFTLNKVKKIEQYKGVFWRCGGNPYYADNVDEYKLINRSCLSITELDNYLKGKIGYAWHISNLVIFDRPKELSEFYNYDKEYYDNKSVIRLVKKYLTKAPQSFCYIEVE